MTISLEQRVHVRMNMLNQPAWAETFESPFDIVCLHCRTDEWASKSRPAHRREGRLKCAECGGVQAYTYENVLVVRK